MTPLRTVGRRQILLRGLSLGAGASVLLPVVRSLVRQAHGQTPTQKRLVMLFNGNGFDHKVEFAPPNLLTKLLEQKPFESKDFTLSAAMKSLQPYRDRLLLLYNPQNFQGPSLQASHYKNFLGTTCMPLVGKGAAGGISIDQFIAERLPRKSPFKTVNLFGSGDIHELLTGLIARKAGDAVPNIAKPSLAMSTLFATSAGGEAGKALGARRVKLMDIIGQDVQRLQKRFLAGPERLKFELYIEALKTLDEERKSLSTAGACESPNVKLADGLEERFEEMIDITAAALICGLTQIVTLQTPGTGTKWPRLTGNVGTHAMSHGSDNVSPAGLQKIHNFHAEQITRLCDRLSRVPEGDGTMFDNTMVFWSNHNAEGHHGKGHFYPSVIVGNAGRAIKADGRIMSFSRDQGTSGYHSLGDVYCGISHAMGVPTDTFGKDGMCPVTGPIPGMMG